MIKRTRQERVAHQVLIDRPGCVSSLSNCPDDQTLAAGHVAGSKDFFGTGSLVGVGFDVSHSVELDAKLLEHADPFGTHEAHREQYDVRRIGLRGACNVDELHPSIDLLRLDMGGLKGDDMAVFTEESLCVDRVLSCPPFLMRGGDSEDVRPLRPRVDRGAAFRRSGNDFKLMNALTTMPMNSAQAIRAGVAAADDDDVLILGSILILNIIEYVHSWDIVKFASVAAIALGVSSSATIFRVTRINLKSTGIVFASLLALGTMAAGLAFPLIFAVTAAGIPEPVFPRHLARVTANDARAISWLRHHVGSGESVYRDQPASAPYSQHGGLPGPWFDSMTESRGYSQDRLDERRRFLRNPPDDPDRFLAEHINWLVLAPSDERLNEYVDRWIGEDRAKVVNRVGRLRIVHLIGKAGR